MGELLALTPADFDFQACTIRINKSYQRLEGKDIITDPKTVNSLLLVYFDSSSWCSATVEYRKVLFPATSFSKNMGESFFLQYAFSSARYYI